MEGIFLVCGDVLLCNPSDLEPLIGLSICTVQLENFQILRLHIPDVKHQNPSDHYVLKHLFEDKDHPNPARVLSRSLRTGLCLLNIYACPL